MNAHSRLLDARRTVVPRPRRAQDDITTGLNPAYETAHALLLLMSLGTVPESAVHPSRLPPADGAEAGGDGDVVSEDEWDEIAHEWDGIVSPGRDLAGEPEEHAVARWAAPGEGAGHVPRHRHSPPRGARHGRAGRHTFPG